MNTTTSAPLARSRHDRHVAGVAGGLGHHFGVDPTLVRIGFVALAILGGSGVALYLLGWLLLPEEDGEESLGLQLVHHRPGEPWPVRALVIGGLALMLLAGVASRPFGLGFLVPAAAVAGAIWLLTRHNDGTPPPAGPSTGPTGPTAPPSSPPSPPPPASPAPPAPPAPEAPASQGPSAPTDHDTDPLLSDPIVTDPLGVAWRDSYERWPAASTTAVAAPVAALPPARRHRIPATTMSAVVALAGVVLLLDLVGLAHIGAHGFAAAALIVVGCGLVASAWGERAWSLIPVAAALMLTMGATAGTFTTRPVVGSRRFAPASAADLQRHYRVTFGDLDLDLSHVDFGEGKTTVEADVSAGRLVVTVPRDVRIDVDARSGAGQVDVLDQVRNGPGSRVRAVDGPSDAPGVLVLDLRAGAGAVEVQRAA